MKEADLLIHREDLGLGTHMYRYEWRGPANAPLRVAGFALNEFLPHREERWPSYIEIGNYPLRLIPDSQSELFAMDAALYARVDGLNRLAWLRYAAERVARRLFEKTYCRVILTLSIWGLARVEAGSRPSWRDIGRK